jgi:hypothetical protein
MSNVFTLDSLREETVKRYEPTKIELPDGSFIELKSVLRIGKKDRDSVLAAIEEINSLEEELKSDDEDDVDGYADKVCKSIEKIFKLVADKPKRLTAELDHEVPAVKVGLYTAVLSRWMGDSQLGEVESSPSS